MKEVQFSALAYSQFLDWKKEDKKMYSRIENLINIIQTNPYGGIGKPEPLKYELSGYWSRRIDKIHRLVYKVTAETIIVVSCKYHY
jgi:toxin YoeB